jgi:hypothetical protein
MVWWCVGWNPAGTRITSRGLICETEKCRKKHKGISGLKFPVTCLPGGSCPAGSPKVHSALFGEI